MNIFFWLLIAIAVGIGVAAMSVLFPVIGRLLNALIKDFMDNISK